MVLPDLNCSPPAEEDVDVNMIQEDEADLQEEAAAGGTPYTYSLIMFPIDHVLFVTEIKLAEILLDRVLFD